jgi:hypothetical protein
MIQMPVAQRLKRGQGGRLDLYQPPETSTLQAKDGRLALIDFARTRHANPARIPVSPLGCWYYKLPKPDGWEPRASGHRILPSTGRSHILQDGGNIT